ncbi:MAG: EamA family transporter [Candidatus Eisenbacteria bacterium]|nr:EamA family transporter [Candidatus Eisenbacteria bacterium]
MSDQGRAYVYAGATVLMWSTVASAFKIALRYQSPLELLLWSTVVSVLVLGGILAARGKLRRAFRCTAAQYRRSLLLGLLNPFLYYVVLFEAYDRLPAQLAQPLNYTWALTLAYLSVPLLGQRLSRRDVIAGLVAYSGVVVLATRGDLSGFGVAEPVGVALALGSTIIWAFYWIGNTRDERDATVSLFLCFLMGLPFVAVAAAIGGITAPGGPALLGALYVGVVEMGVSFVFWLKALRLSENASRVGYLIFLSPFVSLLFIRSVVGEPILASTPAGLALIVAGLIIQRTGRGPATPVEPGLSGGAGAA